MSFDNDETGEFCECPLCSGQGTLLGILGRIEWARCRNCGADFQVNYEEGAQS